jgi:hypothetical protein
MSSTDRNFHLAVDVFNLNATFLYDNDTCTRHNFIPSGRGLVPALVLVINNCTDFADIISSYSDLFN